MPTNTDRHTLPDAVALSFRSALPRHAKTAPDQDEAELRALLALNTGERAARYVPLPRLIQE